MSSEGALLLFQAHAKYGTWSIDFDNSIGNTNNMHIFASYIKYQYKSSKTSCIF